MIYNLTAITLSIFYCVLLLLHATYTIAYTCNFGYGCIIFYNILIHFKIIDVEVSINQFLQAAKKVEKFFIEKRFILSIKRPEQFQKEVLI